MKEKFLHVCVMSFSHILCLFIFLREKSLREVLEGSISISLIRGFYIIDIFPLVVSRQHFPLYCSKAHGVFVIISLWVVINTKLSNYTAHVERPLLHPVFCFIFIFGLQTVT